MAKHPPDPCDLMARWITATKKEIEHKQRRLQSLEDILRGIKAQSNPDAAHIATLKSEIDTVARELELDRHQLQALEEEYAASCQT